MRDVDRRAHAEADGSGPVQDFLARTAHALGIWIIAGSVPLRRRRASAVPRPAWSTTPTALAPRATTRSTCSTSTCPIAPRVIANPRTWRPASQVVTVDTPAGRLGLSICYDLRFPELYRRLEAAGAQWFVVPAAFTATHRRGALGAAAARAGDRESVLRGGERAVGHHPNGRQTWGHSLIVDYWGRVLAQLAEGEGVVTAEIDLAAQAEARRKFPALAHRVLRWPARV